MPINIVDFFDESDELRNNDGIRIFPIISNKANSAEVRIHIVDILKEV